MSEGEIRHTPLRLVRRTPSYWRVTFDNSPINLFDPEVIAGLQQVMGQLETDPEVKVVVFDSADPDYFISHYDLLRAREVPNTPGLTGLPPDLDIMQRLTQSPVVSIALVRGRARGVGAEFVLACDMSFASRESAILSQWEVGAAAVPAGGSLERLPRRIGRSRTLEIVLGADDFDAATAERYGWINRALPDNELDAFVERLATRISGFEHESITAAKALINARTDDTLRSPDLLESRATFRRIVSLPTSQTRIQWLFRHGLQQRSDLERDMGRHLAEYRPE